MTDAPHAFYLPENPDYTIIDSALDSVRFLRAVSELDEDGNLLCRSIDATPEGIVPFRGMWLEGVGYCADSVFGAHVLVRLGRAVGRPELEAMGWSYLNHALAGEFFDDPRVPVRLYRDTDTGRFLDNLEGDGEEYVEHGHVARVGHQLLLLSELDGNEQRAQRSRAIATRIAAWVDASERCPNGWFPRRTDHDGSAFPYSVDPPGPEKLPGAIRPDPIADRSGAGAMALQLLVAATQAGIHDGSASVRAAADAFVGAGGHFGSVNGDTEDLAENVGYALGFSALLAASDLLGDEELANFAHEQCLPPLVDFELDRDLNGCATKGLLYMETSWNAACTWEVAACATAYLEAHMKRPSGRHVLKALTILRALSAHHHGDLGFLTEAVDWDGHSAASRHFGGATRGDIRTTHPLLNNLYLLEPTVMLLAEIAVEGDDPERGLGLHDVEGNRLCDLPVPFADWMSV